MASGRPTPSNSSLVRSRASRLDATVPWYNSDSTVYSPARMRGLRAVVGFCGTSADARASQPAEPFPVESQDVVAAKQHLIGCRPSIGGQVSETAVSERGFAAAGFAGQAEDFLGRDRERHPVERSQPPIAVPVLEAQLDNLEVFRERVSLHRLVMLQPHGCILPTSLPDQTSPGGPGAIAISSASSPRALLSSGPPCKLECTVIVIARARARSLRRKAGRVPTGFLALRDRIRRLSM